jgi:hypothetical protein
MSPLLDVKSSCHCFLQCTYNNRPQKRRMFNGVHVYSVPGVSCGMLDHVKIVTKIDTRQQRGSLESYVSSITLSSKTELKQMVSFLKH